MKSITIINTYVDSFLLFSKYLKDLYEEGNEDEGILILHSILLLFLPLFL